MKRGSAETYRVFVRNWWRRATAEDRGEFRAIPGELIPDPGARKTTIATHCTEEEAIAICDEYARTHKPGPLSRKAEFERE